MDSALVAAFLSGAAALVYQSVWLRMLTRCFGVTAEAAAILLSLFFAGLAAGSWMAGRVRRPPSHGWAAAYAGLEVAGAAAAVLASACFLALPGLPDGAALLLAGPALLLPTTLFGAALPVLARASPDASGLAGRLYAANTAGALAGVLAGGFVLVATLGERGSLGGAFLLNMTAAGLGARQGRSRCPGAPTREPVPGGAPSTAWAYMAAGFCGLGWEVLWTRKLTMLLGNSSYAFSLVVAALLAGTAMGAWMAALRVETCDARRALGFLLIAAAGAAAWGLALLGFLLVRLDDPRYLYSPLVGLGDLPRMALYAAVVVLPAAVAQGAMFPFAARALGTQAGTGLARAYAWNTAGGIAGSAAAAFLLSPVLGGQAAFLALCALSAAAGGALLAGERRREDMPPPRPWSRPVWAAAAVCVLGIFAARHDPTLASLARRFARARGEPLPVLFHDDTPAGMVTGFRDGRGGLLVLDGIVTAGTGPNGALMAALPQALAVRPGPTLVVGMGAGVTLGAAARLGPVDVAELNGGVVRRVTVFQPGLAAVLSRPDVHVFRGDGRRLLLRSPRRYAVVVVDISPPLFSAGAVNLYTEDFFRIVLARLESGGVLALWLPLPGFAQDYLSILAGLRAVFPSVRPWTHPALSGGFLVFASSSPLDWGPGELELRLAERVRPFLLERLDEKAVLEGFRMSPSALSHRLAGARPVTDDSPRTAYPLGRFLSGEPLEWSPAFLSGGP